MRNNEPDDNLKSPDYFVIFQFHLHVHDSIFFQLFEDLPVSTEFPMVTFPLPLAWYHAPLIQDAIQHEGPYMNASCCLRLISFLAHVSFFYLLLAPLSQVVYSSDQMLHQDIPCLPVHFLVLTNLPVSPLLSCRAPRLCSPLEPRCQLCFIPFALRY